MITPDGGIKWKATHGVNEGCYWTTEYVGWQYSSLRAAIVQQFLDDGYMVRDGAARSGVATTIRTGDETLQKKRAERGLEAFRPRRPSTSSYSWTSWLAELDQWIVLST